MLKRFSRLLPATLLVTFWAAFAFAATLTIVTAPPPPPPTLIASWHRPVAGVPVAAEAHFDYRDLSGDWSWKWSARKVTFAVDGKFVDDETAAARLMALPVLTWWNIYHPDGTTLPDLPAGGMFGPDAVQGHRDMVADVRQRLLEQISNYRLERLHNITDAEEVGTLLPSAFAKPDAGGLIRINAASPWEWPTYGPSAITRCYLLSEAFTACSWDVRGDAVRANYATNHSSARPRLGIEPYFRATPYWAPASLDGRTTFISGYSTGGPNGCLTEDEVTAAINQAAGPIVLALDRYQPGIERLIPLARNSGKVRLILLWPSTGPDDEGRDGLIRKAVG